MREISKSGCNIKIIILITVSSHLILLKQQIVIIIGDFIAQSSRFTTLIQEVLWQEYYFTFNLIVLSGIFI